MAATKSGDSKQPRKIIDVAEPGKSAPPTSSKPIIVSNRPMLRRDPMMLTPDGMDKEVPAAIPTVSRVAKTIKVADVKPVSASDAVSSDPQPSTEVTTGEGTEPVEATAALEPTKKPLLMPPAPHVELVEDTFKNVDEPKDAKAAEPMSTKVDIRVVDKSGLEESKVEVAEVSKQEALKDAKPAGKPESETAEAQQEAVDETAAEEVARKEQPIDPSKVPAAQTSVPDGEAEDGDGDGQLAPNQTVDQAKRKEEEEKLGRAAEIEKVIESRQFYLPINAEGKRRSLDRTLLVLAIVLVLALVWLDIVLDAGILKIGGIQPVTHFFKP